MTSRKLLQASLAALAASTLPAWAQEKKDASPAKKIGIAAQPNQVRGDEITPQTQTAIEKGLAYLAAHQSRNGSWSEGSSGAGITGLAGLALMSGGNLPGRGKYGENVQRAVDYVCRASQESGLIAADNSHGPMYGHGFATLFLGEVYGMTAGGGDTALANRLHEALVKAVHLIEQTQNEQGGWRYNPLPYDADVSVTICQIMGLRSARNAGIEVSKQTIERAIEYVRRCQNPDGGFKYQLESGASGWPRSAAGVASLYYAGIYQDDAIDRGIAYLQKEALPGGTAASKAHYFYGHYYAVQAMYLSGGQAWSKWWPAIREELLKAQGDDGSWEDRSVGSTYGTSMALIILQMPKRYLPIFQK